MELEFLANSTAVTYLQLDSWFCHGSEWVCLPVDLLHLLPHHHVEAGAVLVRKYKTCIVVVRYRINMKCSFKIYSAESCVTCRTNYFTSDFVFKM